MDLIKKQQRICKKYGFEFEACDLYLKVVISLDIKEKSKTMPIHALRHRAEGGTTGWYIWAGEYSEDDDFFKPMHAIHLEEFFPIVLPYLGLPSGTRFLIAEDGNYVDIWEDLSILSD
ncbi:hypothetical protein D0817_20740 [Flavobacterium cupreum]|uniref:Imm33-like domain-containing protein n=2 Tax=Flavobacterium TaxID=237 RepID=A0A434A2K5_9FLAO|nr:hypothetical protein [Flavobacterium cupreum]RUT68555.1 hypothetical protein D0817_20740 [Flavobacterium cupreum]